MKPLLSLALSAGVLKQLGMVLVATLQDDIRDQLLERRIVLHNTPRTKGLIRSIKNGRQVSLHILLKARECP
jgi:hypothetical protein